MYSNNNIFITLMATSFGHNGHHQAISQKLKKPVHIVQNRQFIWDPISFMFEFPCKKVYII